MIITSPVHDNPWCVSCGPENPLGMQLRWRCGEDFSILGTASLREIHEGANGAAHGGLLSILFDEVLGLVCEQIGTPGVTASLTVDFRRPVLLPATVEISGRAIDVAGRKISLVGEMRTDDGVVVASAEGLWIAVAGAKSSTIDERKI